MADCHHHDHDHDHHQHGQGGSRGGAMVTDPVCGMNVDPAKTAHHAERDGKVYHFCSAKCRERFEARPELFLDPAESAQSQGSADVEYLSNAHSDRANGPRKLPDLRHGFGAEGVQPRCRAFRRICRYEAALRLVCASRSSKLVDTNRSNPITKRSAAQVRRLSCPAESRKMW